MYAAFQRARTLSSVIWKMMDTPARGQQWEDCDADIRAFIRKVVESFRERLGERLVGVYLHGSLATGCYRRAKSDVDLLVVVRDSLSVEVRRTLSLMCVALSRERPTTGDLELSVIQLDDARRFIHPLPYEMHFGSDQRTKILSGEMSYEGERRDRDLAAHCTLVRARGVCLFGAPIEETFGPVRRADFLDAVLYDFEWLVADDNILESPFYCVLNCCRVLQLLSGSDVVANKEEGGLWGLENLPAEHRAVVRQAFACYCSSREVSEEERKRGGLDWNADALRRFRDFAAQEAKCLSIASTRAESR